MSSPETAAKKRKAAGLIKLSQENDIRYRGPLSYQHFQAFGWFCIVLTFAVFMMKRGSWASAEMLPRLKPWIDALEYVVHLSLPFLMVANFSLILDNAKGYGKQILKNGAAMLGVTLVSLLVFNKYILGTFELISAEPEETLDSVTTMVRSAARDGFISFNIFVDLFLCTTFMFFLDYKPRRIFRGKARIVFRLFALLPIAYEAASIYFKAMASLGKITIPVNCYPLLTVKPPVTFVVFIVMAFFIKTRELRFRRHGKTHEEFRQFLKTNRNSLHFSVFSAIVMLAAGALDFSIAWFGTKILGGSDYVRAFTVLNTLFAVGFGESIVLAFLSPVMLLFSYTRKPKYEKISTLIPVVGIGLIVLVFLQGSYQILKVMNLPRLNLKEVSETVRETIESVRKY